METPGDLRNLIDAYKSITMHKHLSTRLALLSVIIHRLKETSKNEETEKTLLYFHL